MNRDLKNYDSCLYAQESRLGRIDIYRKSKYGGALPHLVMSLTDNWNHTGKPVDYGSLVIMDRIRAMDLWRDDGFVENYIKNHEKAKESADRDRKNNIESFLYDFRSQFHKATNDINTSTLEKVYRKEGS